MYSPGFYEAKIEIFTVRKFYYDNVDLYRDVEIASCSVCTLFVKIFLLDSILDTFSFSYDTFFFSFSY